MKPGRKLMLEAILVPLVIWMALWGLFYFRPRVPSQKMTITLSGLITAVVSFFIALAIAFFIFKRRLERERNSKFGFRELLRVIDETDIGGYTRFSKGYRFRNPDVGFPQHGPCGYGI
ncbi:hypothetical protein CL1_0810 [Thermococcus cleftensis]|uniref:Uncharacterized protein n=1 Tax=Thermococcus cleftensis (strain DSM 27260 / KACC 17922 / CL1) TaxID=163003 RepID=I3ZTI1_THECF|nr:hypothetical protein [Thermococcus cleftensis]AFL95015.1 hypothetical protein CL1_0810 [Thermococcus cleftensis]